MDFLARHFEKLILAACLLSLIWCNAISTLRKEESRAATRELAQELKDTRKLLTGEKLLEAIDESSLDSLDSMLTLRCNDLDLVGSERRGRPALFESMQFVVCKNRDCKYILPYNLDTCPYCHTEQAEIGKDLTMEDDLDEDGIPDLIEKASLTLNYRYPKDAMMDFDGDGFLNIEEYRAGTDMDDGFAIPELAYLLRVKGSPAKRDLPFKVSKIKDSGGSTDVTEWKATVNLGGRNMDVKLGAEIAHTGYTVTGFAQDKTAVNVQDAAGTDYTVPLGVKANEKSYSVDFVYMLGHIRGVRPVVKSAKQMMVPETDEERAKRLKAAMARNGGVSDGMGGMGGMGGAMNVGMGDMGGYGTSSANGQMPMAFTLHENDKFFLEFITSSNVTSAGAGNGMDGAMGMGAAASTGIEEERKLEYYQLLAVEEVEEAAEETEEDAAAEEVQEKGEAADAPAEPKTRLVVRVQRLTSLEDGEPVGKPIEICVLDNSRKSRDYLYNGGMGGTEGMGGMGMGMGGMMR